MDNDQAIGYINTRGFEILLQIEQSNSDIRKNKLNEEYEFLCIARDAIDKQTPEKPLPETKFYGNGKCPRCNVVFLDKSTNYCGNCGQALDWSDSNA